MSGEPKTVAAVEVVDGYVVQTFTTVTPTHDVAEWRRKAEIHDRVAQIVDEANLYYRDSGLTRDQAVDFLIRIASVFPAPEARR